LEFYVKFGYALLHKMIVSYYIFLFLLIFAPLAFGTVELWSLTVMETLCFIACLIYFYNPKNRNFIYQVPGILPLILFLCYVLMQILPLPSGLVGFISPSTLTLYQETIGLVEMPAWLTLSVNPRSTLEEFFRFSAYFSFYILSIQILTDARRLKKTVFIVLGLGAFIAMQAILQTYLDNGRVYWFRVPPPTTAIFTGPFFYHNHFAGFVEMLVPIAIAIFFRYRPTVYYGDSWRQRLVNIFTNKRFNTHLLLGFTVVLMAASIFVSMSRGGMISFGISCFMLLVVLTRYEKKNSSIYLGIILLGIIFLSVSWFGWNIIDQRFGIMFDQQGQFQEPRPLIWQDAIGIIKDFPITGTGWGTFGNIYPSYRTYVEENFNFHAHNDYIETLCSGGIISLALIGWFLGAVFLQTRKTFFKRRDSYAVYLTLGSMTGILAILIHSIVDFNFQNGANGLYFFFLLALVVSASHTRRHGHKATILKSQKKNGFRYSVVLCNIVFLLMSLQINSGSLLVKRKLAAIMPLSLNKDMPEEKLNNIATYLDRALKISPLNSYTHFLMAEIQKTLGNDEAADRYYKESIRLDPAQATYLQDYGVFLDIKGERSLADSFMQAGILHDLIEPERKRNYAKFLFSGEENEKGLGVMRSVFIQDPKAAEGDIAFLIGLGLSVDDIRLNLPDRVVPYLALARHVEQKGDQGIAAALHRQALTYINEKDLRASYFIQVYEFFYKQKRYEESLDVILQAIEFFPANAELRVLAGKSYRKMGLTHQAAEQFQQALAIDQVNSHARKQLEKLKQQVVDKKIKL